MMKFQQRRTTRYRLIAILMAVFASIGLLQFLQRSRTVEGVWLWQHEGSNFYEGADANNPCPLLAKDGSWLDYGPEQVYGTYDFRAKFPGTGANFGKYGAYFMESFKIRFIGRKVYQPLGTGHMGLWWSRFEVERIIAVEPIRGLTCRFPYRDR